MEENELRTSHNKFCYSEFLSISNTDDNMPYFFFCIFSLSALLFSVSLQAQNRQVQNKPYIDARQFHYGFFFGVHDQGLSLRNNGKVDPATGAQWLVENDRSNFGFQVGVLGEWKLSSTFALRAQPSLFFGSKHLSFLNQATGERNRQDMKSTYISLPLALKMTAPRFNNYRPYVLAGIHPMYDLTANKHTLLRTKRTIVLAEVGFGCDFYLPFFKLIPELKFSFGLSDILDKRRTDLTDPLQRVYTNAIDEATANMLTLSFYFE